MDKEFWVKVELLSFGGTVLLLVIPYKRYFQVILDDLELCNLQKNKEGQWIELEGSQSTIDYLGSEIDAYLCAEKGS